MLRFVHLRRVDDGAWLRTPLASHSLPRRGSFLKLTSGLEPRAYSRATPARRPHCGACAECRCVQLAVADLRQLVTISARVESSFGILLGSRQLLRRYGEAPPLLAPANSPSRARAARAHPLGAPRTFTSPLTLDPHHARY